jgi:hypothetical protein
MLHDINFLRCNNNYNCLSHSGKVSEERKNGVGKQRFPRGAWEPETMRSVGTRKLGYIMEKAHGLQPVGLA